MLKFCGACGAPLTTASNLTWQPPTTHKPGGELRFVTIVFADLAGFTSFAEDRPPDEVARIVGDLLQRLTKAVEENNGSVYQYLGDAVVATFGLPRPDPNATRNAVRAGLDMQGQRDAAIGRLPEPVAHRNISAACRSRMATSGDRSMPEIVGRIF